MCIKLGSKIELSPELQNLGQITGRKVEDLWHLIISAQTNIREESNIFWDAVRKEHPELDKYEMIFLNNEVIVTKFRSTR